MRLSPEPASFCQDSFMTGTASGRLFCGLVDTPVTFHAPRPLSVTGSPSRQSTTTRPQRHAFSCKAPGFCEIQPPAAAKGEPRKPGGLGYARHSRRAVWHWKALLRVHDGDAC